MSALPDYGTCDRCGEPATVARDAFVKITFVREIVTAHVCADCGRYLADEARAGVVEGTHE